MTRLFTYFGNSKTLALACVALLLPWQTRYIFGGVDVAGTASEFSTMSIYIIELVILALLVFAPVVDRRAWSWQKHRKLVLSIVLGCLVVALSALFSAWRLLAFSSLFHVVSAGLILIALFDDDVRVRPIVWAFVVGLLPSFMLGVFQVVFGGSPSASWLGLASRDAQRLGDAVIMFGGERVLRAYGTFPHPNIFAGYVAVGLVAWIVISRAYSIWLRLSIAAAFIFALLLTASRSAALGLLIAAIVSLVDRMTNRRWVAPSVGGVLLMLSLTLTFLFPSLAASLRGGGATEDRAITERVAQYQDYPELVAQMNFVVGSGVSSYVLALSSAKPGRSWWEYQPIHNVAGLMFIETGVLGVLFALMFARQFVAHCFIASLVIVLCVIAVFDHYLWSLWPGLVLSAFVLGMSIKLGEETR